MTSSEEMCETTEMFQPLWSSRKENGRKLMIIIIIMVVTVFIMSTTGIRKRSEVDVGWKSPMKTNILGIIGMFPYNGSWRGGISQAAGALLGIYQINSLPHVLPGYRLHMVYSDTRIKLVSQWPTTYSVPETIYCLGIADRRECDPGVAIKLMYDILFRSRGLNKIMFLGAGCSEVTEVTARVSHLWNLVQISYSSTSPRLSRKADFPLFARVVPSEKLTHLALLELFRSFGWKRIATIHELSDVFSGVCGRRCADVDILTSLQKQVKAVEAMLNPDHVIYELVQLLHSANFTVLRSEVFRDDPSVQVRNLKENKCNVIVGVFYAENGRKVFCEAYKIGLYGARVVWILPGWFDNEWWLQKDLNDQCTPEELTKVAEGNFYVGVHPFNPNPEPTISGWLPSDFQKSYNVYVKDQVLPGRRAASNSYDAIWAMALTLNRTRQHLEEIGSKKRLEDFTFEDSEMARLLYSSLLNVSFMSMQGPLSFDKNGDPITTIGIIQIQDNKMEMVAMFNDIKEGDKLNWSDSHPVKWKEGSPPLDSPVVEIIILQVSTTTYLIICVLATMGIILAIFFLVFNIAFRNVRVVKMSSPRLNNVILLGCICIYASVFSLDTGGVHGVAGCEIKIALLTVGVSLTFGALFAKTWRVYVIFTNSRKPERILGVRDLNLLMRVGILLLFDAIVLITWRVVDPLSLKKELRDEKTGADENGEVVYRDFYVYCNSKDKLYFQGTLLVIHALLMAFGTFFAWETRNVHYVYLNDSKYIGMCIYKMVLLSITAVVLSVNPSPIVDTDFALNSGLLIIGITITQCILFVPKIITFLCDTQNAESIHEFSRVWRFGIQRPNSKTVHSKSRIKLGTNN